MKRSNLRDDLITQVMYGKIKPAEAEDRARAAGLPGFEKQPDAEAYDPMGKSRWSVIMALAWIAWRDPRLVMEQDADYRDEATIWRFSKWRRPTDDGTGFQEHEGWFLENWSKPSVMVLTIADARLRHLKQLPASARITPAVAEKHLWLALSEDRLKAEALNPDNELVEIPPREWRRLKLFEEGKQIVLKYEGLDRCARYKEVEVRRHSRRGLEMTGNGPRPSVC